MARATPTTRRCGRALAAQARHRLRRDAQRRLPVADRAARAPPGRGRAAAGDDLRPGDRARRSPRRSRTAASRRSPTSSRRRWPGPASRSRPARGAAGRGADGRARRGARGGRRCRRARRTGCAASRSPCCGPYDRSAALLFYGFDRARDDAAASSGSARSSCSTRPNGGRSSTARRSRSRPSARTPCHQRRAEVVQGRDRRPRAVDPAVGGVLHGRVDQEPASSIRV